MMGAPVFPRRSIEDTIVDLIQATEALAGNRATADRIVVDLETRWAANRAARMIEAGGAGPYADGTPPLS